MRESLEPALTIETETVKFFSTEWSHHWFIRSCGETVMFAHTSFRGKKLTLHGIQTRYRGTENSREAVKSLLRKYGTASLIISGPVTLDGERFIKKNADLFTLNNNYSPGTHIKNLQHSTPPITFIRDWETREPEFRL